MRRLKLLAFKVFGIDEAILNTLVFKFIQLFGGLFTMFFLARYLSPEEQGYYFTFASLAALQMLFELGLSGIIVQFVAHECVKVTFFKKEYIGDDVAISRLSSLLYFSLKWFGFSSILLGIILIPAGFIFFNLSDGSNNVSWKLPWVIMVIWTCLNLFLVSILSFLEGLGFVDKVARFRAIQNLVSVCIILFLYTADYGLLSTPIGNIIGILTVPLLIFYSGLINNLKILLKKERNLNFNYRKEILPLQWRIALSWISGYFIFQLFNPILFSIEGPIVAGKFGLSLTVLTTIFGVGFSWISTKVPAFSNLIALKKFNKLNEVFKNALIQSTFVILFGFFLFISILKYLIQNEIIFYDINFETRFLNTDLILILSISILCNHIIGSLAVYLRCHKKEPLFIQSIIFAILTTFSLLIFSKSYGVTGVVYSYSSLSLIGLIWTTIIFNKKRNEWHY